MPWMSFLRVLPVIGHRASDQTLEFQLMELTEDKCGHASFVVSLHVDC